MSKEGLQRFYGGDTEALQRVHNAYMDGISAEAQAFIDKNDLHHLAHHPEFENIRAMAESEHLEAIKRLREGESSGPERDDDAGPYIRSREEQIRSGERNVSRREKRALLRR